LPIINWTANKPIVRIKIGVMDSNCITPKATGKIIAANPPTIGI
jgi:hypothetical protein